MIFLVEKGTTIPKSLTGPNALVPAFSKVEWDAFHSYARDVLLF